MTSYTKISMSSRPAMQRSPCPQDQLCKGLRVPQTSYAKVSVSSDQLCKGLRVFKPTMQRSPCSSDQLCKGLRVLRPAVQRSPCLQTNYAKVTVFLRPAVQRSPCLQTNYAKVSVSLSPAMQRSPCPSDQFTESSVCHPFSSKRAIKKNKKKGLSVIDNFSNCISGLSATCAVWLRNVGHSFISSLHLIAELASRRFFCVCVCVFVLAPCKRMRTYT